MANTLSPSPKFQAIDASGTPLAGGFVYTYLAGTNTPATTYINESGTANTNPIVLDAAGRATIYLSEGVSYKFVVQDSSAVQQYIQDNIRGPLGSDINWGGYYFDDVAGHFVLFDPDDNQLFNFTWDNGSGASNYTYKPNTSGGYLGIVGAAPAAEVSTFAWNSSTTNGSVAGFFAAHHAASGGLSYLDLFRYDVFSAFLRGWRISMQSARGDDLRFTTVESDASVEDRVAFTRDGGIGLKEIAEADAVSGWHVFYVDTVDGLLRRKDSDGIVTNLQPASPITVTDATYSVVSAATSIIANRAGTVTLTLPDATVFLGRELCVRTIQAQTVVSDASNVVPLIGGSAGTAILPATDGAWALLQSDGTNWQISESGAPGGGGGGMVVGDAVTGGTAGCILYVGSGPVLAQDTGFTWDTARNAIVISSSGNDLEIGLTPEVDLVLGWDCLTNAGSSVGANIAIGKQVFQGALAGEENIGIGTGSLGAATGANEVVAMGRLSGATVTTADGSTFVGSYADGTATDGNQNSFGFEATCTGANQVTLGNSSIATLRCQQTSITALSDRRDKTNIQDLSLGLDFINAVRPVSFYWVHDREMRQPKPGQEAGFIAQELQEVSEKYGAEWLRLVDTTNPDKLEATPGRLFPAMVKAIQQLSQKVAALEAR